MVRISGYQGCASTETTVLAHYRLAGTNGVGMKPDDEQAAWACARCHDIIDGRVKSLNYSKSAIRQAHADGVFRTQYEIRRGDL